MRYNDNISDTIIIVNILGEFEEGRQGGRGPPELRWFIIEISSGLPRKSSVIFGIFRKKSGNVRVTFGQVLEKLWKSSERGRESSDNCAFISMSM